MQPADTSTSRNKPGLTPIQLASGYTIARYRKMVDAGARAEIAELVRIRFVERYLRPIKVEPKNRHGFTMIAIGCLMIEALESFARGWPNTNGKSETAFKKFFERWNQFSAFRPVATDFYKHVRCGLLHQAETTGGWRIVRRGPLLSHKTINATRFVDALTAVLDTYVKLLQSEAWDGQLWTALRAKMDSICDNAA